MIEFTEKDKEQLKAKGIAETKVVGQIETFKEGIPFVNLKRAAVVGDGIYRFSNEEEQELVHSYEHNSKNLSILKFVPASGAASRMFKALFNFLDAYNAKEETLQEYIDRTSDKDIKVFSEGMENFPFYQEVKDRFDLEDATKGEEVYAFVSELMGEDALNYGFYPKGLLPFHKYDRSTATPFEEHLKEGSRYGASEGKSKLHFTISKQHEEMFKSEIEQCKLFAEDYAGSRIEDVQSKASGVDQMERIIGLKHIRENVAN